MTSANQKDVMEFARKCKIYEGTLKSPIVWSVKQMRNQIKYTKWQIFISLYNDDDKLNITAAHIKRGALPEGTVAHYWTTSSQEGGKVTTSKETVITTGKNVGSTNETTVLTQAILDVRSEFNAKLRRGGSTDKDTLILPGTAVSFDTLFNDKGRGPTPWRVHQMALQDVSKVTAAGSSNWRYMTFPGYIQPKYDGTRFTVVGSPLIVNTKVAGIDGFSRGLESYEGHEHILKALLPVVQEYPGLYLDGELWKKGVGLQFISGSARRLEGSKSSDPIKLDYYIFDCFWLDKLLGWEDRRKLLLDIQSRFFPTEQNQNQEQVVLFAPSRQYNSKEEALEMYEEFIEDGYEGGVLRNKDSPYEYGLVKEKRSYQTMKIKPMPDEDWPVVGFTSGDRGKDVGAIKWILEATAETITRINEKYELKTALLPNPAANRFTAVTKGLDYPERYAAFQFLTSNPEYFEKNLAGKLMRVQYSIISAYGKPQQPKVLGFRDLDLNKRFLTDIRSLIGDLQ